MSNSPLITSKVPYATDSKDVVESHNRLVKTINSSFRDKKPELTDLGNIFVVPYSYPAGAASYLITIDHGLGMTPSGYLILYNKQVPLSSADYFYLTLSSMNSISVKIVVTGQLVNAISGEFKFLILR